MGHPKSGRAAPSVPGFSIKGNGTGSRMGARIAAARQDGSESESSSRQLSARSTGTNPDAELDAAAAEESKKSWLEMKRAEEDRLAAQLEKDTKIQTRRLNLKVSKYKVEIKEATKSVDDLVDVAAAELAASSDIVEISTGLAEAKDIDEGRIKKSPTKGRRNKIDEKPHSLPERGRGLMQSVRALSETTLKVVLRKKRLEEIVSELHREYLLESAAYKESLSEIQSQMKSLREQKENSEFNMKDRTIQFETRLKTLQREYDNAIKKVEILNVRNADLRNIVDKQDGDIMDVPRLEESYLRKARSIVLDKEKEVTQKNILLYKQQADIEQVTFWRSQALALNEQVKANEESLVSLKKQMAQLTHQNLGILAGNEQLKRENFTLMCTGGTSMGAATATRPATTEGTTTRERSASPSGHGRGRSAAATAGEAGIQSSVPFGGSSSSPQKRNCSGSNNNIRGGSSPSSPQHKRRSPSPFRQRRMSAVDVANSGKPPLQIQLEKVKELNDTLQCKLDKANKALANQRAYPLYTSGQGLKMEDMTGEVQDSTKIGEQAFLDQLFDSDDDKAELASGKLHLEEQMRIQEATRKASEQRIEKAVRISTAYKAKLNALRNSRPGVKHLRQIREKREAVEAAQPKMF